MRTLWMAILLTGLLSACAQSPEQTLEEKLAGKTPEQRERILRVACLNEAEHIGNPPRKALPAKYTHQRKDTAQTMRLKELCRQMEDAGQVNEKEQ
jgi:hypothetical protein